MKLAVVSDNEGNIVASAVCQVFFEGDLTSPTEVSLEARPVSQGLENEATVRTASALRTSIVDAPSFLEGMAREHNLLAGLARLVESMQVDVADGEATLRGRRSPGPL